MTVSTSLDVELPTRSLSDGLYLAAYPFLFCASSGPPRASAAPRGNSPLPRSRDVDVRILGGHVYGSDDGLARVQG